MAETDFSSIESILSSSLGARLWYREFGEKFLKAAVYNIKNP